MKVRKGQELEDYIVKNGQPYKNPWVEAYDKGYALKCWNCGKIDLGQRKNNGEPNSYKHMTTLCSDCWNSQPNLEM